MFVPVEGVTLAIFITQVMFIYYWYSGYLGLVQVLLHKYSTEHKRDATLSPGKMWKMTRRVTAWGDPSWDSLRRLQCDPVD